MIWSAWPGVGFSDQWFKFRAEGLSACLVQCKGDPLFLDNVVNLGSPVIQICGSIGHRVAGPPALNLKLLLGGSWRHSK